MYARYRAEACTPRRLSVCEVVVRGSKQRCEAVLEPVLAHRQWLGRRFCPFVKFRYRVVGYEQRRGLASEVSREQFEARADRAHGQQAASHGSGP